MANKPEQQANEDSKIKSDASSSEAVSKSEESAAIKKQAKKPKKEKLRLLSLDAHTKKYPAKKHFSIKEKKGRRLSVQLGEVWNPVLVPADQVSPVQREFPGNSVLLGPKEKRVISVPHEVCLISDQLIGLVDNDFVELRLLEDKDDSKGKRITSLKKGQTF